jgi:branched-subunit amino acid transport protein
MSTFEFTALILGMAALSALTRSLFFLSQREWPLPLWLRQGLRFGPVAALMGVVAPEVVLRDGALIHSLLEPRLLGAAVAIAVYVWRRDLLSTIVWGTAAMLLSQIALQT